MEQQQFDRASDEISVADLLRKLWLNRVLLLVLPAVFMFLAVIMILFTAVKNQPPTVFYIQLQGINNATYPNGTSFSPQDLLIPEVLERAALSLKLPANADLHKAVQVEYGVPTTVGLQLIYKTKLAAKGLTTADIATINSQYKAQLKSSTHRGLRITVNHSLLGLSSAQGEVLANALPRAWGEIFTQKYRVLVNTGLENVSIVSADNRLTTTSEIIAARSTLIRIKNGLHLISSDNRLKAIVSTSGFNSSDLKSELQNFQELYFHTLFTRLFANADATAKTFKTELGLKIKEINLNIEELNRSLVDLSNFRVQSNQKQVTQDSRDIVQLGGDTLQQVVALANQASMSGYMQKILTARRELFARKAVMQTELSRASAENTTENSAEFLRRAHDQYSSIVEEYTSLLKSARKISRESYGNFYQPLGTPYVIGSILPKKSLLIVVLALILGVFSAVLIALVRPVRD